MRLIDADELRRIVPMAAAIDALEVGFRDQDPSATPPRSHVETPAGSLLLMPAAGEGGLGVKLVTISPQNPTRGLPFINAVYVLFDKATQTPEVVIDGGALTALRTAAVSGLATRYLARPDAASLVVFGAGVEARSHLDAMLAVRPIERVVIVSRTATHAEALAATARDRGIDASVGGAEAVAEADLLCTCTTSSVPLFDGELLVDGTHVNAVGTYQPHARELDTTTVRRGRVVVETREAALSEAGDLLIPIGEGAFGADHIVADLAELLRGADARGSPNDITVFKSVGLAFEDLIVARAAVDAM